MEREGHARVPDRHKVFQTLGASWPPKGGTWYNLTDLDHRQWLHGILEHRFVLAPFGHGLDTHRISEILLLGGIPVMRRSSISSCYDDSDNDMGPSTTSSRRRGSLPVVILDSWKDLTEERLEREWNERFKNVPRLKWDHQRLLLPHWLDRIANMTAHPR